MFFLYYLFKPWKTESFKKSRMKFNPTVKLFLSDKLSKLVVKSVLNLSHKPFELKK